MKTLTLYMLRFLLTVGFFHFMILQEKTLYGQLLRHNDPITDTDQDYTPHFRVITPEDLFCTSREVVICHDTKPDTLEHFAIRVYLRRLDQSNLETWEVIPFEECQYVYVLSGGTYELIVQCIDNEFPGIPKGGELLNEYTYYFNGDAPNQNLWSHFEFQEVLYTCNLQEHYNINWVRSQDYPCAETEYRYLILATYFHSTDIDTIYAGEWTEGCPGWETKIPFSNLYAQLDQIDQFWPVLQMNAYDCPVQQHGQAAMFQELIQTETPEYTLYLCKDTADSYQLTRDDILGDPFLLGELEEWVWADGTVFLFREFEDFGIYNLHIRNACFNLWYTFELQEGNCDDISVEPVFSEPKIYIPNAFSPNGDGINDIFKPEGLFFQPVELTIWDRFGSLIYRGRDEHCFWNGLIGNDQITSMPMVFVYSFTYLDLMETEYTIKGEVTLMR